MSTDYCINGVSNRQYQVNHDFDSALGRANYSIIEREKIKFASFPLAGYNYILIIF